MKFFYTPSVWPKFFGLNHPGFHDKAAYNRDDQAYIKKVINFISLV